MPGHAGAEPAEQAPPRILFQDVIVAPVCFLSSNLQDVSSRTLLLPIDP